MNFVEYIVECLSCAGLIRYRKMMGGYCLCLEDKVNGMVCDNSLYIKKGSCTKVLEKQKQTGNQYREKIRVGIE